MLAMSSEIGQKRGPFFHPRLLSSSTILFSFDCPLRCFKRLIAHRIHPYYNLFCAPAFRPTATQPPRHVVGPECSRAILSHLICMAVDCLTANCDEGTNAAAEAAIMAPRARENFIVEVEVGWRSKSVGLNRQWDMSHYMY